MPVVDIILSLNQFWTMRIITELFPTPDFPTNITLKVTFAFLFFYSAFILYYILHKSFTQSQQLGLSLSLCSPVYLQFYSCLGSFIFFIHQYSALHNINSDNFIMRNKKQKNKPEVQVSFAKQNNQHELEFDRLNIQMLRVNAAEKQRILDNIWEMNQQQLCTFFTTYRLFPQQMFTLDDLLNSNNLKLIKHDGKIYFGQIDKKKRSGVGICFFKQGKLYEGQFVDNERTGCGIQIYSNGNLYIGQFLNNKKHGKGQFFWFSLNAKAKDGIKSIEYYQGEWWGGLPDGQGIHQKNNGDLYKGSFKNGLKHGIGLQYYGNGDFYKGQYVNGLPEGFGQYEWTDGSSYKGDFKQGLRSGYGIWRANNQPRCQNYQGQYSMDKKCGYGVYEWQNGWIYRGNFENDYRNGYGQLFDGQQCVYKGFWVNGEQSQIQQPPQPSKTARTTSIQMSRVSGTKPDRYETFDTKQIHLATDGRSSLKGQYTIKKRPQSFSTTGKYQATNSEQKKGRLRENPQKQKQAKSSKSIQRQLFKINNLYVPGIHSSRVYR